MNRAKRSRALFCLGFLSPALLLFGTLVLWPLVQTVWLSLHRFSGLSQNRDFIAFRNYETLFASSDFLKVLGNMSGYALIGVPVALVLAMVLALALNQKSRMTAWVMSFLLIPQILSVVAVASLWRFVYLPTGGLLAGVASWFGVRDLPLWLGDPVVALPAVVATWIWYAVGFYALLFLAGLQNVPGEVQEAAKLDGAWGWRLFSSVVWPLTWSVRKVTTLYAFIQVFGLFGLVIVMTEGGPARSTESILTYLVEVAFENSRFGQAAAIGVVNLVLVLGVVLGIGLLFRRDPAEASR
ncbi:MAG: sugar ABC transporter permease [Fimbriimonadaceae bacterium]|jgi:ABC-type sugar transport system permease subunit|nr:sugar ABC transporter permease [Fimbriimonadaceae bacterium]